MLDLSCTPSIAEAVVFQTLDDEAIVLNVDKGAYYVLNATATFILQLVDGQRTLGEILQCLCRDYDVAPATAESSLLRLAQELEQAQMITLAPCLEKQDLGAGYAGG